MKVVVTGLIATYPAGGVIWDYGQYLLGFDRLGADVVYLEDSGAEDVFDEAGRLYSDASGGSVHFLAQALDDLPFRRPVRWHLRSPDGQTYGMSPAELEHAVADADLFLNVSGGALLREEYTACPRTVLIDTDPGLNHFVNYPTADRAPGWRGALGWRAHSHHFTYATRLGTDECRLPPLGVTWRPTRPPVVLDAWHPKPPASTWTTVMSWSSYGKVAPIVDDAGREYFAKETEWPLIEQVPRARPSLSLQVAVREWAPIARWTSFGWTHVDPRTVIPTALPYREYVQSSRAELSVAKNVYVATHSGWFSCRSVCYLAAHRPVVTQDTGFMADLPTGNGLIAFSTMEGALAAVDDIERNYQQHADAARGLAEHHFDAERVLTNLLHEVGL